MQESNVEMTAAVELRGITKRFPGVVANDNVNLVVQTGEIHAIVGENGAGKSTLMKILYGMQAADEGQMLIHGSEVSFKGPSEAIEAGIGMVHQHFMLADNLTVLENVILGSEPTKGRGRLDIAAARTDLTELGSAYGLDIDFDNLVEVLEVGERQRVEIIKVLYRGAKILILDEPTAVLVPQEVDELFRNLRQLQADGHTIIFIDHKLEEVLEIADSITVIRRGKTVASVKASDVSVRELAELMVGSELPSPETSDPITTDEIALNIDQLTVHGSDDRPVLDNVSFQVRKGEILGIAGIEGNGQGDLFDAILGLVPARSGSIVMDGQTITSWPVRKRREAGLGIVPAERHSQGLLLEAPLWENAMLGNQTQAPYAKGLFVDRAGARGATESIVHDFDVRTPNIDVAAHALSGGNQQKLIIGRELGSDPSVLLAAHPTRGIDIGAQAAVWDAFRVAKRNDLAIVLISADLDELIGLSDRLMVMFRGRLVAELAPGDVTPAALGAYMTGAEL